MPKLGFSVTYDIVTEESVKHGDVAESGFLVANVPFCEALETFQAERDGGVVEADSHPVRSPRWFADTGAMDMVDGSQRSVSLHLPDNLTDSSRMRIARLVGCYGVQ